MSWGDARTRVHYGTKSDTMAAMEAVAHTRQPEPRVSTVSRWLVRGGVAVVVAALLALAAGVPVSPETVGSVVIDNPGGYPVVVSVRSSGDGSDRLPIGTVGPGTQASFAEVLDAGAEWQLTLQYAGRVGGEYTIPRSELEEGWQVPDEVYDTFESEGLQSVTLSTVPPEVEGTEGADTTDSEDGGTADADADADDTVTSGEE